MSRALLSFGGRLPCHKLALALFEEGLYPVRPAVPKNQVVVHVVSDVVFRAGVFGVGNEVFQFLPIPLNGSFPVFFFAQGLEEAQTHLAAPLWFDAVGTGDPDVAGQ